MSSLARRQSDPPWLLSKCIVRPDVLDRTELICICRALVTALDRANGLLQRGSRGTDLKEVLARLCELRALIFDSLQNLPPGDIKDGGIRVCEVVDREVERLRAGLGDERGPTLH